MAGDWWFAEEPTGTIDTLAQRLRDQGAAIRLFDSHALPATLPERLAGLVVTAPPGPADASALWRLLELVRRFAPALRRAGGALFLVQRFDGAFGLHDGAEPSQGALAGLAKTALREWPEVRARAIDLAPSLAPAAAAELLAAELTASGPGEVGLRAAGRYGLRLEPAAAPAPPRRRLAPTDVILLSGGARGVTAAAALAFAAAGARRLLLLGRSQLPTEEPAWLAPLTTEAAVKAELARQGPARPAFKELQRQWEVIAAGREVRQTLAALAERGVEVRYGAVDLRDGPALAAQLQLMLKGWGPIVGIVHGAGVLADRRLEDLREEDFRAVYATKVAGLENLLANVDPARLRFLGLFSSTTARLGRVGQAAYAMANEVLNKMAQDLSRRWPQVRTIAFNWGPWDGGMVKGGLKGLFAKEGVGLIPQAAGASLCCEELLADEARPAELVVLAPAPPLGAAEQALAISTADFPELNDHQLRGRPVVPLAWSLRWLADAAAKAQTSPLIGFEDVRVFKGLALEGQQPMAATLRLEAPTTSGEGRRVKATLSSLAGRLGAQPRVRATLLFGPQPALPSISLACESLESHAPPEYGGELFHGPHFQALRSVRRCDGNGILVEAALSAAGGFAPLLLDAAFQAVIVWSQRTRGVPNLPTAFRRFLADPALWLQPRVLIEARRIVADGARLSAEVSFFAADGRRLGVLEGYEAVLDASLHAAFAGAAR